MNQRRIHIIFRTCDKVNAVNKAERPFGLDKKEIIKISFLSLIKSASGHNFTIKIIGDNLSDEMVKFFQEFPYELIQGTYGNENSLKKAFELATELPKNDWVYFCEDDYLHTEDAFSKIVELINEYPNLEIGNITLKLLFRKREIILLSLKRYFKKPGLLIFPSDYPDRYISKHQEKSLIFSTSSTHWRQIRDITFTFLMPIENVVKNKNLLFSSCRKANDRKLSRRLLGNHTFYSKMLALSPIPSLACHLHKETMSPIVNWKNLIQLYLK